MVTLDDLSLQVMLDRYKSWSFAKVVVRILMVRRVIVEEDVVSDFEAVFSN